MSLHDLLLAEGEERHIDDRRVLTAIVAQALHEVPAFMARSWLAEQWAWYLDRKAWEAERDAHIEAARQTPEARLQAIVEQEDEAEMRRYLQGL